MTANNKAIVKLSNRRNCCSLRVNVKVIWQKLILRANKPIRSLLKFEFLKIGHKKPWYKTNFDI